MSYFLRNNQWRKLLMSVNLLSLSVLTAYYNDAPVTVGTSLYSTWLDDWGWSVSVESKSLQALTPAATNATAITPMKRFFALIVLSPEKRLASFQDVNVVLGGWLKDYISFGN